jgi:hypothetical protein
LPATITDPAVLDKDATIVTAGSKEERSSDVMAGRTLIDQALATVVAAESLGPGDQSSLTPEQALVWAIYLRVIERHQFRLLAPVDRAMFARRSICSAVQSRWARSIWRQILRASMNSALFARSLPVEESQRHR